MKDDKIYKLQQKIRSLEEKEAEKTRKKQLEQNYKKFLERPSDWVIGKAHADIGDQNRDGYWRKTTYSIGDAISIHGNAGTSYKPEAMITSATNTYFHNVWTDEQRRKFQEALNRVALEEIHKIMGNLRNVLEVMGLQSTSYYLSNLYPANKIENIKENIAKEIARKLNTYSDQDFIDLVKHGRLDLSHSRGILKRYLSEHRPELLKKLEEYF